MIFSSGLGSVEKQTTDVAIKNIANHLRKLQDELEYRLSNLDSSNINEIDTDETVIRGTTVTMISQSADEIAELKLSNQQLTASVQGLGNTVSSIQMQAGSIQMTVEEQGRSISSLEQTAGGLTATVQTQGQSISTLQQTSNSLSATVTNLGNSMSQTLRLSADGVTITNAAGSKLTIDGGQINADTLNLTGKITFTDLDAETQAKFSSSDTKAYLESIGVTEITKDGVKSPRIEGGEVWGAKVYGGIFSNAEAENFLRMRSDNDFSDPDNWSMVHVLEHFVGDVDQNMAITQMGYVGGQTTVGNQVVKSSAWVLFVLGSMVLTRDTSTGTMKALGKWDFSGATVTGL